MKRTIACASAFFLASAAVLTGCRTNAAQQQMAPIVDGNAMQSDPAASNMLPAYNAAYTPAQGTTQYAPAQYGSQARPSAARPGYTSGNGSQNEAYRYNTQPPQYAGDQQDYSQQQYAQQQYAGDPSQAPLTDDEYDQYSDLLDPNVPAATQPPPPLPVDYEQPEAPGPDYLWTPGYWDYADTGYYYVPGAWVGAPYAGALWTPGWWGYGGGRYRWHHGYWGRHVGYYGGINYGFGFIGFGYQGGYWNGDHFFYNRAVNRISPRVVNNYVYDRRVTVTNNTYVNTTRVSYFGGPGGLRRGPTAQEFAEQRQVHTPPMQAQIANRREAMQDRQQFFRQNNGRPNMVFAAHALQPDRNVSAPPRAIVAPGAVGNGRLGFGNGFNNGTLPPNASPQQRQQLEQLQRNQQAQQLNQQRQQDPQRAQQQQFDGRRLNDDQQRRNFDQQRLGNDAQRLQFQQQRQQEEQQRAQQQQQFNQQRDQRQMLNVQRQQQDQQQREQANQQRQNFDQQRLQLQQQRQNNDAQRLQFQQQRQQENQQRAQQQQFNQQREQQQQQFNQQREQQQANEQRMQQQRQQGEAMRQQVDAQRQQQANAMRQQQDNQRQQQDAMRQQMDAQRQQQQAQRQQQMQQQMQQRQEFHQQQQAVPRAAPSVPRMEPPHAGPGGAPHERH